jgi:hypothetical protein
MGAKKPRTTTKALEQRAAAAQKRAHAQVLSRRNDPIGAHFERLETADLDKAAEAVLATPDPLPLVRGAVEALLTQYPDQADDRYADWFRDTLQTPDLVTATASLERLRLLVDIGCDELAQDVAETIQPRNSLERMLAGQLAAAHTVALRLLAKSVVRMDNERSWPQQQQADSIETCRLATTATRLLSVFQEGLLTLAKLRTGGKQTVVVQHVHVADHAQAVVAGAVTPGGRVRGESVEKEGTIPCTAPSTPPGPRRAAGHKRGKGQPAKALQSAANGAVACTEAPTQAALEATSTP